MENKTIITMALLVVSLLGLMWWGKSIQRPVATAPGAETNVKSALTAPERFYDFGTIAMANGKVEKLFKVTNPTAENINVRNVVTSCMCTVAYIESGTGEKGPFGMPGHGGPVAEANEVIKAGESRDIKVVYDPNAHGPAGVGAIDRFIYLTDASGGTLQLEIKAVVTP